MWTTLKSHKKKVQSEGLCREEKRDKNGQLKTGCFTNFNLRATNNYRHKTNLAFCLNRFISHIEAHFFDHHKIKVDEDLLALSDLLQWIFG